MSETLFQSDVERRTLDIEALNAEFARLTPRERIALSCELLGGDNVVVATNFGPTDPVLLVQVLEAAPSARFVTVRHGHETEQTLGHADFYTKHLNLNLHIYKPNDDVPTRPPDVDASDFQWRAKIEPFRRALNDHNAFAYISGVMAWQTDERSNWPFVEQQGDVLTIRPVLDVTADEVDHFFEVTGFPRTTDYYDPTKGPDQKQECRLNTTPFVGRAALSNQIGRPIESPAKEFVNLDH